MRDISFIGKVLLSKVSKVNLDQYVSLSLDVPPKVIKELDKILYDFIWRKKHII